MDPMELPRIISVDDHVIEPAHLFSTWLPAKYRDRGPQPLTAGIGELAYVAGKYQITMDPDGPPDRLVDLRGPEVPVQAQHRRRRLRPRRHDPGRHHARGDAARLLGPEGPPGGHGPQPCRGQPLLPHLPALLRPDVRRGQGQGGGARLRARLQRLDGRGVVRRQRGPAHPALHHPPVGHRPRRRRDPAQRRARRQGRDLLRDPHPPGAAVDPLRLLGPVLRRVPGDRDGREHAHRLQSRRCPPRPPTPRPPCRPRSASTTRWRR